MNAVIRAVRQALERGGLWRENARLLCALSGGSDSVALIHALCRLRAEMRFDIHALHVQHGLRGEESYEDEQFVRKLCHELAVPLVVENANLTGDMHTPGMETLARDRRRILFEKHLQALQADALLTAHHQDDQAETVLMHLLRGSGLAGLCGMKESVPFGGAQLVRPLLALPKRALLDFLVQEGLAFREDASNQQAVTPRNALRLEWLPGLEKLFPEAAAHLAQTAHLLSADEAFLSAEAERLYEQIVYAVSSLFMLRLAPLAQAPEALVRRVLRRWYADGLKAAGIAPDERSLGSADTLALSALVHAGERINLPCGLCAIRGAEWLHLMYQDGRPLACGESCAVPVTPDTPLYQLSHLTVRARPAAAKPSDAKSVILPPQWLACSPVFRLMQPEDRIRPFGAPGSKPLRRLMTDRKIDPQLRSVWPVLCAGSEVLWVPGLCSAEALRLTDIPSGSIELSVSGVTPFISNSPKE